MTENEKLRLLEEILDVDMPLMMETTLGNLEEWDSLSMLSLVVKVKELYGTNLTTKELNNFKTVRDICNYLK